MTAIFESKNPSFSLPFTIPNCNIFWSRLVVEELVRNGVDFFCISPGSRSTPLVISVAEHSKCKVQISIDERGAAYHALGYGRGSQKPAVLICTSGTAMANYLPAVIEAYQDQIPMLILTADRPPELQERGANQTINQSSILDPYLNWQFLLPCPSEKIQPSFVLSTINQSLSRSNGLIQGPVHLNFRFREPLTPKEEPFSFPYSTKFKEWCFSGSPYSTTEKSILTLGESLLDEIVEEIKVAKKGILLLGSLKSHEKCCIAKLIQKLNWPVFADITSGFRLQKMPQIIPYFDQLLQVSSFQKKIQGSTILHLGGRFLSKNLQKTFEKFPPKKYSHFSESNNPYDPSLLVSRKGWVNLKWLSSQLMFKISKTKKKEWLLKWQKESQKLNHLKKDFFHGHHSLQEVSTVIQIIQNIKGTRGLFLSNSLPIRESDRYGDPCEKKITVGANRGASGIEGMVACASGFARGLQLPVTLITGDLSFFYDLNSLHLLSRTIYPLQIVLINNGGGGIFSFLPIAKKTEIFETYFATSHNLSFEKGAKLFQIDYYCPKTTKDFISIYKKTQNKTCLIEVICNRQENYQLQTQWNHLIQKEFEKF